jgi:hypothetical protein
MATARSTKEVFDYVLLADRSLPAEKRTTFHLASLPTATMIRLRGLVGDTGELTGEWVWLALRVGVRGWRQFVEDDGTDIPFTTDAKPQTIGGISVPAPASEASLNRLSPTDAFELAGAVVRSNMVTVDDAGN